ncbi:MAG: carotenoid 1,2-hydratase [Planctomycetes bacterium]|nr:carotenoid 1,2-hydratase [Planctomycetota bacterium]
MFKKIALMSLLTIAARGDDWKIVKPSPDLSYPRDHGAHFDHRTEWWYVTGEVAAATGESFGYQFTIFRRGMIAGESRPGESALRPRQVFAGHFAITDIKNSKFTFAERLRRRGAGLADAAEGSMHAFLENWEIIKNDGGPIRVAASDAAAGAMIQMDLDPAKALVAHGSGGYSKKGPEVGNASVYVSFTRCATKGIINLNGREFSVKGESWFDHEFGTSQLGKGVAGWDWFGLRMDDGRELMIYGIRKVGGGYIAESGGTLVDRNGATRVFTKNDFSMEVLETWKSSKTGASYPIRWRVSLPSEKLNFEVRAKVKDCELDSRGTTGVVYWEGPVQSSGDARGSGFMELTGYVESLGGKF